MSDGKPARKPKGPMTRAASDKAVESLVARARMGIVATDSLHALIDHLLEVDQDWADDTFLALLGGTHGAALQNETALLLEGGFPLANIRRSFVRTCLDYGRVELLGIVADLGLPDAVRKSYSMVHHKHATTDAGRWLDALANAYNVGNFSGIKTTFAREIGRPHMRAVAPALADILVKHDPTHKSIGDMVGNPGHALIVEALMRSRIQLHAAATESAPSARRSARHV